MNPYLIPLIALPAGIALAASLMATKVWKWFLLLSSAFVFWVILQPFVQWAFLHPFDPNDGGAKTFALFFGWAYGLILVTIPTYWISKGAQSLRKKMSHKNRQQTDTADSQARADPNVRLHEKRGDERDSTSPNRIRGPER